MAAADSAADLLAALAARRGHFRYESGHHGDLWLELEPLFVDPARLRAWAGVLAERVRAWRVEVVCGPLTGGALLAQLVALELGTGCVYTERANAEGLVSYRLPAALRERVRGRRVLLVDDAINAANAVRLSWAEIRAAGGRLAGVACLLALGPAGAELAGAEGARFAALAEVERSLWRPEECPRCRAGEAPANHTAP